MAKRIAISLRRAAPLAIIMFARFNEAINKTTAARESSIIAGTRSMLSVCGLVEMPMRAKG